MLATILYLLSIPGSIALVIYASTKKQFMLTFMERDWIAIRESGGTPIGLIGDPPPGQTIEGLKLKEHTTIDSNGNEVTNTSITQDKEWWEKLGLFIIGYPWHTLKRFDMIHERMAKNIDQITDPKEWIERDPEPIPTWYLKCNPTHDFLIIGTELSEGWVINSLAKVELVLVDPLVAAYERNGKFYPIIGEVVRAGFNDAVRGTNYKDYQKIEKDADSDLSVRLCADINKSLPKLSGYKARRILFSRWDPIDPQRDKLNEKAAAKIKAEALKALAKAENAEFREALKVALSGRDPKKMDNELYMRILREVKDLLNKKHISKSNLSYYGESGSHMPPPPPIENRKGPRK